MKIRIYVRLKQGVLDVQGKAVEHTLELASINGLTNFRIGKILEFEVNPESLLASTISEPQLPLPKNNTGLDKKLFTALCSLSEKLFSNTVIESYEIETL